MNTLTVAAPTADPPSSPLRMFDCLAPFFPRDGEGTTNWSKIPFARLEADGLLDGPGADALLQDVERYLATMASLGYDAVAIDDLAHLVTHPFYPDDLRATLERYRALYRRVFAVVRAHGLRLFAITDYMFYNPAIEAHLRATGATAADLFAASLRVAFAIFPEIDGVVLRIGESDGVDVAGAFKSRLTIERPRQARALLERLIPLFEEQDKTLVVRTWTLGAYAVGDLMWNPRTFDAVFGGLTSRHLIVSLKYGDADFFRHLAINPLLFRGPLAKIVEVQCRREYEGMGEFPSFVGWLYAGYLDKLREGGANLAGVYAIQAGGWAPFRRLAYCGQGSFWNELNTEVTVKLFSGRGSVEEIVADFCRPRGVEDVDGFLRLLALSERAIEEGLYVREFAANPVYFRRVRIPPLTWVFWNNVTTGGLVANLHRYLVRDKAAAVAEGHRAVETVREMARLARQIGLTDEGIAFQLATFEILAELREVLLGVDTPATGARLAELLPAYRSRYPMGYRCDYEPSARQDLRWGDVLLFRALLRPQTRYRRRDLLLLNRSVTRLKARLVRQRRSALPRFVDSQGMSADVLLR